MNISHYKNIEVKRDFNGVIPHIVLHKDIQTFICDKKLFQEMYNYTFNDWYLFIHCNNGDRIDVQLN